jgi:peptidoglycan-associated lipoprotein
MEINKWSKLTIVALGFAAMVGCSSTHKGAGTGAEGAGAEGAYGSGVGQDASFTGEDKFDQATTRAPYNQTYQFAFNKSDINPEYTASLNAQAQYILANPSARILIEGNTDSRGSREYNIALGERRAKSVANVLMLQGVKKEQMRIVSYGAERPVALGNTEEAYRLNRRANLIYEAK